MLATSTPLVAVELLAGGRRMAAGLRGIMAVLTSAIAALAAQAIAR